MIPALSAIEMDLKTMPQLDTRLVIETGYKKKITVNSCASTNLQFIMGEGFA